MEAKAGEEEAKDAMSTDRGTARTGDGEGKAAAARRTGKAAKRRTAVGQRELAGHWRKRFYGSGLKCN